MTDWLHQHCGCDTEWRWPTRCARCERDFEIGPDVSPMVRDGEMICVDCWNRLSGCDVIEDDMVKLTCDCGQEYEIRDDAPKWSAAWFVCPSCFLAEDRNPT